MIVDEIEVIVKVYPTEDLKRIIASLQRFFPSGKIEVCEREDSERGIKYWLVVCKGKNLLMLDPLKRELSMRGMKELLGSVLKERERDYGYDLIINKQAMVAGRLVLDTDCCPVLGNVSLIIKTRNKDLFYNWFTI